MCLFQRMKSSRSSTATRYNHISEKLKNIRKSFHLHKNNQCQGMRGKRIEKEQTEQRKRRQSRERDDRALNERDGENCFTAAYTYLTNENVCIFLYIIYQPCSSCLSVESVTKIIICLNHTYSLTELLSTLIPLI